MSDFRSESGRPLASPGWLSTHHQAKLAERTRFAESLAALRPRRVVDLGCGTGLWLDLLDTLLPPDCEVIGLDSDAAALDIARATSARWSRAARFEQADIESDLDALPQADLALVFNVLPYVADAEQIVSTTAERCGSVAIRQYDGDAFRFGPMATEDRASIDSSLRAATLSSEQFRHYDMDRTFEAIGVVPAHRRSVDFEIYRRVSPFDDAFLAYARETVRWTSELVSDAARAPLDDWAVRVLDRGQPGYWVEVELSAVLS